MVTLSTAYQRTPQPRTIACSWPLCFLIATTRPIAQPTCVPMPKACPHSAALISLRFVDRMAVSFQVRGGCLTSKSKLTGVGSWRMKERKKISEQIGCQLESAGDMVDSLFSIVAHDERICSVS